MCTIDDNHGISRRSRSSETATRRVAACALPAVAGSVPAARRFVRSATRHWSLPESVQEAAALIVTELATNAVRHSGSSDVAVLIGLDDRALTIEVKDRGQWRSASAPTVVDSGIESHDGRGLRLVNAYSTGCMLWCEPAGTRAVAKVPVPLAARLGSGRPELEPHAA